MVTLSSDVHADKKKCDKLIDLAEQGIKNNFKGSRFIEDIPIIQETNIIKIPEPDSIKMFIGDISEEDIRLILSEKPLGKVSKTTAVKELIEARNSLKITNDLVKSGLIKCASPCSLEDIKILFKKGGIPENHIKELENIYTNPDVSLLNKRTVLRDTLIKPKYKEATRTAIRNTNNLDELDSIKKVLEDIKEMGLDKDTLLEVNNLIKEIEVKENQLTNIILKKPYSRVKLKPYDTDSISDLLSKMNLEKPTDEILTKIYNENDKVIGSFKFRVEPKGNEILIRSPEIRIQESFQGLGYSNDYRKTFENEAWLFAKVKNKPVNIISQAQFRTARAAFKTGNSKVYKNGKLIKSLDEIQVERGVLYQIYTEFNP